MKKLTLSFSFLTILAVTITGCSADSQKPSHVEQATEEKVQQDLYTCPMHPSVISDRPGACPVCGMALVKKSTMQEMTSDELRNLRAVSLSPTQRVLANVTTSVVERRTLARQIAAVGIVDVAEPLQATVAARFRGRIEKLHVNYTGETISKGQPLFELYSPDLITAEQDFLLALEALQTGELNDANRQTHERLVKVSRDRLHLHFGMTEEQIQNIERTQQTLSTALFHSPIEGTVLLKSFQEGQYVNEGEVLYQLANLTTVWVYLDIYEKDLRFLKTGQEVIVSTETYPGEMFQGRVAFIDPVLNTETRTVRIRATFQNRTQKLKPQMYVKATLNIAIPNALVVPVSAVLSTGKRDIVWVETKQNVFEPRTVTIGARSDSFYEILHGVRPGERIAMTGGYLIDSESALQHPNTQDPHAGHSLSTSTSTDPQTGTTQTTESRARITPEASFDILVKGTYSPDVIRVKKGKPVRLNFYRDEESVCTNEIVFEELNLRHSLTPYKVTSIDIIPQKSGEIHFTCGMKMVHGKIIVE